MITFPPKFTGAKLKQLARLCGTSRSGIKSVITDRIQSGLKDFKPLAPGTRVLSIDLGIRNLAYCLLEVPHPRNEPSSRKKVRKAQDPASLTPILHVWERLALIPKAAPVRKPKKKRKTSSTTEATTGNSSPAEILALAAEGDELSSKASKAKSKKSSKSSSTTEATSDNSTQAETLALATKGDEPSPKSSRAKSKNSSKSAAEEPPVDTQAAALAVLESDPTTTPIPIEDFSHTRLSALAVELIITRLLPLKPDLVILELQRFRSVQGGASSVLEWTLRVNSLESMIYAILTTLRQLGHWPGGIIESVVARNVLEFMALAEGEGANIWKKERQSHNKHIKKNIIGRMLKAGGSLRIGGGQVVEGVVTEYLKRWEANGKRGKTGAEGLKKLDDLADCLLQGISFIRWQENKRRLLAGGIEALEDQMVDE